MLLYALTIFTSAFLLFLVQPIMAKQILPWFGGSATVWTTCLVFFQTALLAGYAYSDLIVHRLRQQSQVQIHTLLLMASLIVLPIIPGAQWKPVGTENPSWLILGMLVMTIGLPYFLLSTTSPLIQAWFARTHPNASPYRLFALSNFASMLALLGYPLLLEPWTSSHTQAIGWSTGYIVFAILCGMAGWLANRRVRALRFIEAPHGDPAGAGLAESRPTGGQQFVWCALAATGSVLLLAVSNHITQNIAAVPLLWIAPLAIYLLTFILTFDAPRWYRRRFFLLAVAVAICGMAWTLADTSLTHQLRTQVAVFCTGLFVACMFCHGELVRMKPSPAYLTRFYLMISVGGAIGSVLVGILAPILLRGYFELAAALVICALLMFWRVRSDPLVFRGFAAIAALFAAGCAVWSGHNFFEDTIASSRNFYGVVRVLELGDEPTDRHRSLIHGTILHGTQYLDPKLRHQATTYYTATSGVARVIESRHPSLTPLKVGVIGLGTGTLAVWGTKGDTYRFYEINPDVAAVAKRDFTYLGDSEAAIEIALGDARLNLEREPAQGFDVLAIDAFSSDAIPVHLITQEALDIYLRHMKPDGVIAFHVTNRFLDLAPVVEGLAHERGLAATLISDDPEDSLASRSDWVLVTRDPKVLENPKLKDAASPLEPRRDWRIWTDSFNNLLQVLR